MNSGDFFKSVVLGAWDGSDTTMVEELDKERLSGLITGPDPVHHDVDVALALMDLVRDDFQLSGTSGGERLSDLDMRIAVRALERVCVRTGLEFTLPFRDHSAWRSYWIRKGASGSGGWQARRDFLSELFDVPYARLLTVQDGALESTLAQAVSPHTNLGWPSIDNEVTELRRRFRTAVSPQDFRAIGNDCVHIMEALSSQVYVHAEHGFPDEDEPPAGKTKLRLERFIDARLSGAAQAELRRFARSTVELAQAVKHRSAPTRTEAGIISDAVILLANMLRRLEEV